jgi:hypothetical protein
MNKAAMVLVLTACALPLQGAVHRSTDLGWKAGQDVTTSVTAHLKDGTFKTGDELVLVHVFRIGGTHQLPDDFVLRAEKGGGFDVIDATPDNNAHFLRLGNRNTLSNLILRYLNTPKPGPGAGTNPTRGVHFHPKTGIYAKGKCDIRIERCRLEGSLSHHLRLSDCPGPSMTGCHLIGGFWTVYLEGGVTDALFRECLIEKCQGDAIKTGRGGTFGVQRVRVERCVFQDCGRDGIDTTGGWKDCIVRETVFRRLFSGMDIKSIYEKPSDLSPDIRNTGILVERCTFTDIANCITFSTLDRGLQRNKGAYFLDAERAKEYAPHDVDINDCIFERTGARNVRMLLLKGGHTIRYKNARFWGDRIGTVGYTNVFKTFGPNSLSREVSEALNHDVTGTLGPSGNAREPGNVSVPFACGPG